MSKLARGSGVLSVVVVITLLVGSTVLAQGPLGATKDPLAPLAQIIAKLDQILALLSPAAPEPGPVTLTTGILRKEPGATDSVACFLTNLGSNPLAVSFTIRDVDGNVVTQHSPVAPLPSGSSAMLATEVDVLLRCEFSFVGFANNVRASAQVIEDATNRSTAVFEAR